MRIVVAALVGTGVVAAAVGVGYKYRFLKQDESGRHIVIREDGKRAWDFSEKTASTPQQAVETAEEMDLLIQQGRKELISVHETEVNGRLDHRLLMYQYTLSDGRTLKRPEDDPETGPGTLTKEQREQTRRLWEQGMEHVTTINASDGTLMYFDAQGREIPTYERVIDGRTFFFEKVSFTLADGTPVTYAVSHPRAPMAGAAEPGEHSRDDLREWALLRQQNKRQVIEVSELTANGELDLRVFTYRYQLSDGRTMDMKEDAEGKFLLSTAQRQEWVQARKAELGEDLGVHGEEISGRPFSFTRKRFVLHDGTELIWSVGKPTDSR